MKIAKLVDVICTVHHRMLENTAGEWALHNQSNNHVHHVLIIATCNSTVHPTTSRSVVEYPKALPISKIWWTGRLGKYRNFSKISTSALVIPAPKGKVRSCTYSDWRLSNPLAIRSLPYPGVIMIEKKKTGSNGGMWNIYIYNIYIHIMDPSICGSFSSLSWFAMLPVSMSAPWGHRWHPCRPPQTLALPQASLEGWLDDAENI